MDTQDGADLQEAVEDVLQFAPELPFTAESCSVLNTGCKSCGFIAHKQIALSALNEGITYDTVSLNFSDGDGNTVSINKSIADYGNGDVTGNMYVVQYFSEQSTQTTDTYKYKDGAWVLSDKSE